MDRWFLVIGLCFISGSVLLVTTLYQEEIPVPFDPLDYHMNPNPQDKRWEWRTSNFTLSVVGAVLIVAGCVLTFIRWRWFGE